MLITLPTLLDSKNQLAKLLDKTLNAKTEAEALTGRRALYLWIDKLQHQLSADHATFSTLLREKDELAKDFLQAVDWMDEMKNYTMHKLPTGSIVYRPTHNVVLDFSLCADCFTRRVKSILQPVQSLLECHTCNATIQAEPPRGVDVHPIQPLS